MEIQHINSIKDPHIVKARALSSAAGRQQAQKCLLEGEKVIRWALDADVAVEYVLVHDKLSRTHPLLQTLSEQDIACFTASEGVLKKVTGTRYLIPVVAVGAPNMPAQTTLQDFAIVLDGVQDHGNIGTIVRTATGFGLRDILSTDASLDLFYRKTVDASRGHVFDVRLKRFNSSAATVSFLKKRGFQIVATSSYGAKLQSLTQLENKPLALIVGNETHGVSTDILENADLVIQIPMNSAVESLNVGVATGISVYELKYKLVIAMLKQYIRTTLGREVNVSGKLIQSALDAELAKVTQFNSDQVILMMILKCDEVMSLEQVSKDSASHGRALQALLDPLVEAGYIRYADATESSIRLTQTGETLLGQLWSVVESSEEQILKGFSNTEREQLRDFLKRIQSNCLILTQQEAHA